MKELLVVLLPLLFELALSQNVWGNLYSGSSCDSNKLQRTSIFSTNQCLSAGGNSDFGISPSIEWKCQGNTPSICLDFVDPTCDGCTATNFVAMFGCWAGPDNTATSTSCHDQDQIPEQNSLFGVAPAFNSYSDQACSTSLYASTYNMGCQPPKSIDINSTANYAYISCTQTGVTISECSDSACSSSCSTRPLQQSDVMILPIVSVKRDANDFTTIMNFPRFSSGLEASTAPVQLGECFHGLTITCPIEESTSATSGAYTTSSFTTTTGVSQTTTTSPSSLTTVWSNSHSGSSCDAGLQQVLVFETGQCLSVGGNSEEVSPSLEWQCQAGSPVICLDPSSSVCSECGPTDYFPFSGCKPEQNTAKSFVCHGDELPTQDTRFGITPAFNSYADPSCETPKILSFYNIGCQPPASVDLNSTANYVYLSCTQSGVTITQCFDSACRSSCSTRPLQQSDLVLTSTGNLKRDVNDFTTITKFTKFTSGLEASNTPVQLGVCFQGITVTCPNNAGTSSTSISSDTTSTTKASTGSSSSVTGTSATDASHTSTTQPLLIGGSSSTTSPAQLITSTTGVGSHISAIQSIAMLFAVFLAFTAAW
eukprot:TRINITY_DN1637_c0_g4_i1.p1 TRINITY_DN1637_c0_g4~~TRINITY_DN1637_c0_g4_i1.p1  ORF type:complete len:595 (+),score=80.81 TRINITY_DN1637_c0_g4_i1:165-1949(+)